MKNWLNHSILIICLILTSNTFGQKDSLKMLNYYTFFPSELGNKKFKPLISLDARRSFYRGRPVKINGFRLGVEYYGVHRFGIGFYGLDRNVVFTDIKVNQLGATDTSTVLFNAGFGAIFYERIIYKTKKWEFALPAEFLFGNITGFYEHSDGSFQPLPKVPFTGLALGLQIKYNIIPWLAPRVSIGHRFLFNTTTEVRQSFNKAYYSFGIQIMIGELYTVIKDKYF